MPLSAHYDRMTNSPWIPAGPGIAKDHDDQTVSLLPEPETRMIGGVRMQLKPLTQMLILASMIVGMERLTRENVDEWLLRLRVLDRLGMNFFRRNEEAFVPTREELLDSEGIHFNVFFEPRHSFLERHLRGLVRECSQDLTPGRDKAMEIREELLGELEERVSWPQRYRAAQLGEMISSAYRSYHGHPGEDAALDLAGAALQVAAHYAHEDWE